MTPVEVRLDGIDAPEKNQSFGTKSRDALAGLVSGKTVTVQSKATDRYRRTLGGAGGIRLVCTVNRSRRTRPLPFVSQVLPRSVPMSSVWGWHPRCFQASTGPHGRSLCVRRYLQVSVRASVVRLEVCLEADVSECPRATKVQADVRHAPGYPATHVQFPAGYLRVASILPALTCGKSVCLGWRLPGTQPFAEAIQILSRCPACVHEGTAA